jgi:hypothetical protein
MLLINITGIIIILLNLAGIVYLVLIGFKSITGPLKKDLKKIKIHTKNKPVKKKESLNTAPKEIISTKDDMLDDLDLSDFDDLNLDDFD